MVDADKAIVREKKLIRHPLPKFVTSNNTNFIKIDVPVLKPDYTTFPGIGISIEWNGKDGSEINEKYTIQDRNPGQIYINSKERGNEMPRMARVVAPNMPHHVVQRSHNKQAVFIEHRDYAYYSENLIEWRTLLNVKVNAWCLMTNHIHLILNPGNDVTSIGLLMKQLAGRQDRITLGGSIQDEYN